MCVLMFATGVMHGSIGLRLRAAVPFALLLGGAIVWSNDSRPIEERLVAMCAVLGGMSGAHALCITLDRLQEAVSQREQEKDRLYYDFVLMEKSFRRLSNEAGAPAGAPDSNAASSSSGAPDDEEAAAAPTASLSRFCSGAASAAPARRASSPPRTRRAIPRRRATTRPSVRLPRGASPAARPVATRATSARKPISAIHRPPPRPSSRRRRSRRSSAAAAAAGAAAARAAVASRSTTCRRDSSAPMLNRYSRRARPPRRRRAPRRRGAKGRGRR